MAEVISPTGTDLQIAKSEAFSEILNPDDDGTYRTSQVFTKDELPFGVELYARVRHNAEKTGYSDWSPTINFHVEVPANIIGIAVDTSASPITINYIDMDGNKLDNPDLASHAAFKNISMATEDADRAPVTMTKFPRFYIKTAAAGPVGSFAENKLCFWISDMPFEGFRVHPAFKRLNTRGSDGKYQTCDYVYIGTYCGHTEAAAGSNTVLGSKKGSTVATGSSSTTRSNLIQYCKNRNNSTYGQSGWRAYDIYDVSLVRWLGLFWKGKFDFQSAYGTNSTASPKSGATNCKIVFKGDTSNPTIWIDDVWSTYWQHVDYITHSSGRIILVNPMTGDSNLAIGGNASGYTMSTTSGFIKSFCSAPVVIGDESHDIIELFLPKTVVSAESSSLVPDYHNYSTATSYLKVGGYWSNGNQGGIFSTHALDDSYRESYQSYEIVRYENEYKKVIIGYKQTNWLSSRRCGYVVRKGYVIKDRRENKYNRYRYVVASNKYSGAAITYDGNKSIGCSAKYGPFSDDYNGIHFTDTIIAPCDGTGVVDLYSNSLAHYVDSQSKASMNWLFNASCPKGWGKNYDKYSKPPAYNCVQYGQGYVANQTEDDPNSPIYEKRPTGNKKPIYGYVTRYKTAYYNYISTRVAKT